MLTKTETLLIQIDQKLDKVIELLQSKPHSLNVTLNADRLGELVQTRINEIFNDMRKNFDAHISD